MNSILIDICTKICYNMYVDSKHNPHKSKFNLCHIYNKGDKMTDIQTAMYEALLKYSSIKKGTLKKVIFSESVTRHSKKLSMRTRNKKKIGNLKTSITTTLKRLCESCDAYLNLVDKGSSRAVRMIFTVAEIRELIEQNLLGIRQKLFVETKVVKFQPKIKDKKRYERRKVKRRMKHRRYGNSYRLMAS